jgi:hypothetical protein
MVFSNERGSIIDHQQQVEGLERQDCHDSGFCNWPHCTPDDCAHDIHIENLKTAAIAFGVPWHMVRQIGTTDGKAF